MSPFLPLLLAGLACALPGAAAAAACERRSGERPPLVVELYTSEGCSSCPPADRWLSTLKGRNDVLPMAFHVQYWDRLGWADRFATREGTQRQHQLARARGAAQVYTPQVLVQGQDWRRWPALPGPPPTAPMPLVLRRDGSRYTAEVGAAPGRWAGFWVRLAHGQHSRVTAGENRGETLSHDHVVRQYTPLAPWKGAQRFSMDLPPASPERPHRVAFVVTDAEGRLPVQALALDC